MQIPSQSELNRVYGESEKSTARFQALARSFSEKYGWENGEFFFRAGQNGNHW